jgi:hypothetical protein
MSSSQETCPEALQLLNASRKGVQAARVPQILRVPPIACFFSRSSMIGGTFALKPTLDFEAASSH